MFARAYAGFKKDVPRPVYAIVYFFIKYRYSFRIVEDGQVNRLIRRGNNAE